MLILFAYFLYPLFTKFMVVIKSEENRLYATGTLICELYFGRFEAES